MSIKSCKVLSFLSKSSRLYSLWVVTMFPVEDVPAAKGLFITGSSFSTCGVSGGLAEGASPAPSGITGDISSRDVLPVNRCRFIGVISENKLKS